MNELAPQDGASRANPAPKTTLKQVGGFIAPEQTHGCERVAGRVLHRRPDGFDRVRLAVDQGEAPPRRQSRHCSVKMSPRRDQRIDCIVQVQMLGEGFDHPRLSVAAIFRPFRSLAPYIQFVGRVMRVVIQDAPDHPDNQGFVVSHVGLNNDARWDEFRELDLDDQSLIHDWMTAEPRDDEPERGQGEPRRFDLGVLVDHELVSHFVDRPFLDPEDDRVLDELLARPLAGGLTVGDVVDRETLRNRLRERLAAMAEQPVLIPVTPQRRRQSARRRLSERTGSVAARVLDDLGLSRAGRELSRIVGGLPSANVQIITRLLNREINNGLGIKSGARRSLSADETELALTRLDEFGDAVRDRLRAQMEG